MSLAHVRLTKVLDEDREVTYLADTPDLCEGGKWEAIGELVINKREGSYRFMMSELAKYHRVLPPEIYALGESERYQLINETYRGFGWGAWSMRIDAWARQFATDQFFPDSFPDIYPPSN